MAISIASSSLLQQQRLDAAPNETQDLGSLESATVAGGCLDAVALNPQPLPPRQSRLDAIRSQFDAVTLNPQPLPPRALGDGLRSDLLDTIALNPQPLPPKVFTYEDLGTWSRFRFDAVALNPQPLPPKEPEPLASEPRLNLVARLLRGQS